MSLYQFDFKHCSAENDSGRSTEKRCHIVAMPSLEEAKTLGLEYKNVLNETSDAVIGTTCKKQRIA